MYFIKIWLCIKFNDRMECGWHCIHVHNTVPFVDGIIWWRFLYSEVCFKSQSINELNIFLYYILMNLLLKRYIFMVNYSIFFWDFLYRKRRICQPFSHARLNECVEMTNPMYSGDLEDTPAFIQTVDTRVS